MFRKKEEAGLCFSATFRVCSVGGALQTKGSGLRKAVPRAGRALSLCPSRGRGQGCPLRLSMCPDVLWSRWGPLGGLRAAAEIWERRELLPYFEKLGLARAWVSIFASSFLI